MGSSINKQILVLAVPSIIANITTPLLGLVDTAVSGHLGSETYIAAIAVAGSMFNLLYWLFAFLRMSSSGLTAIATGRGDKAGQGLVLYRGAMVAVTVGIIMIATSRPILSALLWFLEPDPATSILVGDYYKIVIWGAPAVLGNYVLSGWFLGMQSSRQPMVISIVINVVNISLSPFLAFYCGLKLEGLAIGTLSAQWIGIIVGIFMCGKYHVARPRWRTIVDGVQLRRYFALNRDIMLRTACLIAVTLWFTREGARQGDLVLAVNALLMQFFIMFSYIIDGFAFAGEALVGRYTGSGDHDSLHRCIKLLMTWGLGLASVFSLVYFVTGDTLLSILTDNRQVSMSAHDFLPWAATVPIAGFLAFIWDGVYIGQTRSGAMLTSMAVATAVFFFSYFLLRAHLGNHGLWLAFLLYLFTRGLVQSVLYNKR